MTGGWGGGGTFKTMKRPGEWQGPSFYPGHSVCIMGPQWLEPWESSGLPVAEDIQPIPRAQIPRGALDVGWTASLAVKELLILLGSSMHLCPAWVNGFPPASSLWPCRELPSRYQHAFWFLVRSPLPVDAHPLPHRARRISGSALPFEGQVRILWMSKQLNEPPCVHLGTFSFLPGCQLTGLWNLAIPRPPRAR